jgi:ribosomal protein L11 methyltransferase
LPVTDTLTGQIQDLKTHLDQLPEFGLPPLREGMTLTYAEEEDWANAWKQYFKPMRLGKRLVIKPGWEDYTPAGGELVLELDPGMAFGTGGHPTTQLCLLALEDHIMPSMKVADIGTGSGILALAAARLGASEVLATDIDLIPRKTARENVQRNALEAVVQIMELDEFDAAARECDLIVANIVANTIVALAPSVAPRLKSGGIFIASGIVEEYHDMVRDALEAVGLAYRETRREDIWVCLVTQKAKASDDLSALERATQELPPLSRADYDWAS